MKFPPLTDRISDVVQYFEKREKFKHSELKLVFSPYRISPLGAHLDHQGGAVLGMTIDAGSVLAFIPNHERKIRLYSMNYPGMVEFSLDNIKTASLSDWGRYARGAAKVLQDRFHLKLGFTGVISGSLPQSGLSSSASAALGYIKALCSVNGIQLLHEQLIDMDSSIENEYLKLQNGILDQASIINGKKDNLLYIDTVAKKVTPHSKPKSNEQFKILILFTGVERELTSSGFNSRVEACKKTAAILGLMGGVKSPKILSDIPFDTYNAQKKRLPEELKPWAAHYFSEVMRVEQGIKAWDRGNWAELGSLMNESSMSTLDNYESKSEHSRAMFDLASSYQDVYGAAVNGGGYGGCVVAIVKEDFNQLGAIEILANYTTKYPELRERAAVYFAQSDDGLRMLKL
ncbi:MAG: galactokinase family protein [Thermodesulfobacteriota bacterium]